MANELKAFGYAVLVDDVVFFVARWLNHAVFLAEGLFKGSDHIVEIRNAQDLNILFWRNGVSYARH